MFSKRLGSLGVFLILAAVGSGLLAQSPQPVGTWVGIGAADNPFGNGAHIDLGDGHVLIVGGSAPDGAATKVVASFDTATNEFAIAGTLLSARTEHTATLLKDGRVLVTGGTTDSLVSTDIEIFDPTTGASTLVAQMAEPRRGHVSALLQNGSVLIAGGYTTENVVLQSAFIFDPTTNSVLPTPGGMNVARASASGTSLIDGRVVIVGGTDGTNDLASAEIYDPWLESFTTASTQLSVPVRGHSAVLLPHNGSVLIAGGTSNGVPQAGADLFLPVQFPDPFSWGVGQFAPTAAMSASRSGAIAGPTATEGYAVMTGGGSNDVERYRFATIKTDKDDYAPGEHALITGTGWQPGEQVRLVFQEDPAVHDDYELTLTADEQGNISTNEWAPEQHDLNVRFYLTAIGSRSRAQMTFTDGEVLSAELAGTANEVTVTQGSNASFVIRVSATDVIKCSATPSTPATARVNTVFSIPSAGAVSSTTPSAALRFYGGDPRGGGNNCEVTWDGFDTPYSVSASVSAAATTAPGLYTITLSTGAGTTSVTTPSGQGSPLADGIGTVITFRVVAPEPATNTPPSFTSVPPSESVNEGATASNSGTFSDPDSSDTVTFTATVGTVTKSGPNSGGTWNWSFASTDGPDQSQIVAITANDGHGGVTTTSFTLTVDNVAPTVSLSGPTSANEGQSRHYTFTSSDPGADTISLVSQSCGLGNTLSNAVFNPDGSGSFDCAFANGPASATVSVQVQDSDGAASNTASVIVNVTNVAPTVSLSGPTSANEGASRHYTFTSSDPGADTISLVSQSCGLGNTLSNAVFNADGSGSFDCTFADGPASETVSVQVQDSDGALSNTSSVIVNVQNVAPTVTLSGPTSADEGPGAVSYTFISSDPGADTFSLVSQSCGLGNTLSNAVFNADGSGSFDCTFADGPASETVSVQVQDSDDALSNTSAIIVNVANLNPTAKLRNDGPINEGGSATISFNEQADASSVDVGAGFRYVYSCDGSTITVTSYLGAGTSSSPTTSCTFGDNGSMTVRGRIFDKDNGYTDYVTYVAVNNVAPTGTPSPLSFNPYTGVASASISFTDPGWLDAVSANFDWAGVSGVGTPVGVAATPPGPLTGTFTGSYTFTGCVAGAIGVTLIDDDGGNSSYQLAAANSLGVYSVGFMAPIKEGSRNIVKLGNVIPVKVDVLDCHGNPVLNRTLTVSLVNGTDPSDTWYGDNLTEGTSVSSADSGNQMRIADGHYMFNLATKGLKTGAPFTIIIRDMALPAGSQNIATAAIELKK